MSLFKFLPWWSTQCPDTEINYDSYNLHCCRLGLEDGEKDAILVGSHSGYFSVFLPSPSESDANTTNENQSKGNFKAIDVILETKLQYPITGIISGKFSTTSKNETKTHIAVLHPMKLSIYTITTTDGVAEHGNQSKLHLIFEHNFKKFTYSMVKGNFGGVKDREFLCVMHMDGTLKFFEQDGITFECQLPGCDRTIPYPIIYVNRIDSFVIMAPSWDVECFRYQDLSQSALTNDESTVKTVNKFTPIWSFCTGEGALDMTTHQVSNMESIIFVLGEMNLYCLSDNGVVRYIKRLDYQPICFFTFVIGWYWEPDPRIMVCVASESGSFLVYNYDKLVWAAELPEIPVALQRANIKELPGAIIILGEHGNLHVGYLGTEPSVFKVPQLNLQELNYEKVKQELDELEKDIKVAGDYTDMNLINSATERDLNVQFIVSQELENNTFATKYPNTISADAIKMCKLKIEMKAKTYLEQVQIFIQVFQPLVVAEPINFLTNLTTNTTEVHETYVYVNNVDNFCSVDITSLEVKLIVTFINKQSIPRVIERQAMLPLKLLMKQTQPVKDSLYKVILTVDNSGSNIKLQELATIFPELTISGHAFGLKSIYNEKCVTIVTAKNTNRYRVQSDDLCPISCVLIELLYRLNNLLKKKYNNNYKILMTAQFSIEKIINFIDDHYESREAVNVVEKKLEGTCEQMRLIERRLIVKIQDRSPGALNGIKLLLNNTNQDIITTVNELKLKRTVVEKAQINLSSVINLLRIIIEHSDLGKKVINDFTSIFVCPVCDFSEQCWEELIAPTLDMLTHIGQLGKNKNSSFDEHPSFAITELDLNRFKRHFTYLYERIFTETKLLENKHNDNNNDIDENDEITNEENEWLNDLTTNIPTADVLTKI